jgi:hypothetical protein
MSNSGQQGNPLYMMKHIGDGRNAIRNAAASYFNGTLPPNSILVDGPNEIYTNASTGLFYAKIGFLWKSWNAYPTLAQAQIAKGVPVTPPKQTNHSRFTVSKLGLPLPSQNGARRKTRGRGRNRKTRGRRS